MARKESMSERIEAAKAALEEYLAANPLPPGQTVKIREIQRILTIKGLPREERSENVTRAAVKALGIKTEGSGRKPDIKKRATIREGYIARTRLSEISRNVGITESSISNTVRRLRDEGEELPTRSKRWRHLRRGK